MRTISVNVLGIAILTGFIGIVIVCVIRLAINSKKKSKQNNSRKHNKQRSIKNTSNIIQNVMPTTRQQKTSKSNNRRCKENKHFFVDMNKVNVLICGFTRNYQPKHPNMNIMTDLIIWSIKQYIDYFTKIENSCFHLIGHCMELKKNGTKIINRKETVNSAFISGEICVNDDVDETYIAQFKISHNNKSGIVCIGIVVMDKDEFDGRFKWLINDDIFAVYNYDYNHYSFCSVGTCDSHDGPCDFGDVWTLSDKIFIKVQFESTKEFGSLYFKRKNNKYIIKKSDNKWKDTKYKIPKYVQIKIGVSLNGCNESLDLSGVWCNARSDNINYHKS